MSKYKKNKAAALKYNMEEDTAPVVIASGYGPMAEKIIDIAEQKGIPVFKDDSAASLLCMLDVGTNIPVELYEVIAAIYGKLMEASARTHGNSPAVGKTQAAGKSPTAGKAPIAGKTSAPAEHKTQNAEAGPEKERYAPLSGTVSYLPGKKKRRKTAQKLSEGKQQHD